MATTTPPSLSVTVPVAVPEPGRTAATVTVKVTAVVLTAGLFDELTTVVLEATSTVPPATPTGATMESTFAPLTVEVMVQDETPEALLAVQAP